MACLVEQWGYGEGGGTRGRVKGDKRSGMRSGTVGVWGGGGGRGEG